MNGRVFLAELRRRNVLRAAVLYIGATWALAQGISQLTPAIALPDPTARWFLIVATIGFPFWLAFAWLYELTPQGIRRETAAAAGESIAHHTARKLDVAIIGVLAVAVVLLASGYFIRRTTPSAPAAARQVAFNPPGNSLVVLPFRNLKGDPGQQYFSDGITEELTDALGQITALRVIAWTTASKLRESARPATDIGRDLNVANLLHGSIEREGNQVRITAELVDTRTGLQLWSQHYDAAFADIFKVQDQVSEAIAGALAVKFAQADVPQGGTASPVAHELVLRGRALFESQDATILTAARKDFEQAISVDPDYADAHALLARVLLTLTQRSDLTLKIALPRAGLEARKALALDPHNADAWVALGSAEASSDPPDIAHARADYRQALAFDPSNADAHLDYGNVLPLKQGLAEEQAAVRLDPANESAWNDLVVAAQDLGDWTQEIQGAGMLVKLDPTMVDSGFSLAFAHQQLQQYDQMAAAFDLLQPATPVDREQVDAGRLAYRAVREPALRPQALAVLTALTPRATNPEIAANLVQIYLAIGETQPALQLLEAACPANPVGCSDLAVNPVYRPLHRDPRFTVLSNKYTTTIAQ